MFGKKPTSLQNTPPIAEIKAARQFSELYGNAATHGSRWFLVAVFLLLLNVLQSFSLVFLIPLKQVAVYLVETNSEKLLVAQPFKAEQFRPDARFVKAEAMTYVRNLMTIDPYLTRGQFETAMRRSSDKAIGKVKDLIASDQPFERLAKQPGLVREAVVTSVDTSQPGLIFATVTTNERISQNPPIVENWRFTIHYKTVPPESEAQLMDNPLGITFSYFERFKEGVK
ncbi:MAG: type IV secretion system protein [Polaromonas sp.]|uniref:type IV secretion system protein n=1 Tax=Polaromonas sp. TaxID=1869339 RepID=UPI0024879B0A|nr:type IV secretion system protein [Polaromonas sp.]MDI1236343.1 type IV secretion system protein [Polaromonas sp.]